LRQAAKYGSLTPNEILQKAIERVVRQSDARLDALREKELALYVTDRQSGDMRKGARKALATFYLTGYLLVL
jgi:hypothetical protein